MKHGVFAGFSQAETVLVPLASLASLLQRQMYLGCFGIYAFVSGQVGGESPAKRAREYDGILSL